MNRHAPVIHRHLVAIAVLLAGLLVVWLVPGARGARGARRDRAAAPRCTPGARTLSPPGALTYPQAGNGGYRSVHTEVDLVDDAPADRLLPGTHVVLTERATHCLSSFSLDFETHTGLNGGPQLSIGAVDVDGHRAGYALDQPTYPGDPHGPDDPNPLAHEASQRDPVGGPDHDPLPPACSPELPHENSGEFSQDGRQCPADKLVITPGRPIPAGARFTVRVDYTGRPGLHHDGDGTIEGWFRIHSGNFVTTEPLGTEDWMPVNDFPTAKPTYRFRITAPRGLTAIANGRRISVTGHPADAAFPHGSTTTVWNANEPIAQYLPTVDVGRYRLTVHDGPHHFPFYRAQELRIPAARRAANARLIARQPAIQRFEERLNGPFPFHSDGVVVGIPGSGDDTEEMETMVTFTGGDVDLSTLYHETMHQWWGDNVTQANFQMTFFKEGMATFIQKALTAQDFARRAGGRAGPHSAAGRRAYERSLARQFDREYDAGQGFWTIAPSRTNAWSYFGSNAVYERPSDAYIALRAILHPARFRDALHAIQRRYGGRTIDERQLEAAFTAELPVPTPACRARLHRFFVQWFDTPYPSHGARRPSITGPGLAGPGFAGGGCPAATASPRVR